MIRLFKLSKKQKGQAFESFRLLIAFILMAAVLAIIIVMVNKTNQNAIIISTQKFEEGFISASKSPGTSTKVPFIIEDLRLKGIISKKRLATISELQEECIGFDLGPGIIDFPNGAEIERGSLKMDLTVYCGFRGEYIAGIGNINTDNCPTYCVLFLNKSPPSDIYSN